MQERAFQTCPPVNGFLRQQRHPRPGIWTLAILLCTAPALHAQIPLQTDGITAAPTVQLPPFDIISIKENKDTGEMQMMRLIFKANGFESENLPVKDLISQAYGIRQDLIFGLPDWAANTRFNVDAKVADSDIPALSKLTRDQRRSMVSAILSERFGLKVHRESRTLPTYDLIVDRAGFKLKPSAALPPDPDRDPNAPPDMKRAGMFTIGPDRYTATAATIHSLVGQLAYVTQRTVIDKTGLTGKYDIDLHWTPDERASAGTDNGSEDAGSIFTVLHDQLGLRLVPSKGPVETLVVDHIDKPSPN